MQGDFRKDHKLYIECKYNQNYTTNFRMGIFYTIMPWLVNALIFQGDLVPHRHQSQLRKISELSLFFRKIQGIYVITEWL